MNAGRAPDTKSVMPSKRRTFPILGWLLWIGLAGLGGATLLALLARVHWFCELFTHFPLQIGAGLAVLLALALLLRQWKPALLTALCLVPNLWALAYYFPGQAPPERTSDLRVITFNVLTSNTAFEDVRTYLSASDADIIFVMETNEDWVEALSPIESDYPHVVKAPRGDNFGMVLYSRHPIASHDLHRVEGSRVPCVHAVISLRGRQVEVIGGHPVPPVGALRAHWRNTYLETLTALASRSDRPKVVLGDFNATVWSPFFRDFLSNTALQDSGRKRGFQSTWQRNHPVFSIPIDHILHSAELKCTSRTIGPALGSDHRPVIAEFAFGS